MKKQLLLLVFMVLSISSNAGYEKIDGLYYLLVESSHIAEVNYTLGTEYKGDIVIPEYVDFNGVRYDVRIIGEKAFYDCSKVTSIEIPNSVFNIKKNAFSGCTGLTSLIIPSSVTSIGAYTFSRCTGLTNIDVPNSVEELGYGAFYGCKSLKRVQLSETMTELKGETFSSCTNLESVVVPENVSIIGNEVFLYCLKLKEVSFGSNIQSIGWRIFSHCDNLADVYCYTKKIPTTDKQTFFYYASYSNVGPYSYAVKYTTLHVPQESVSDYKSAWGWKEFMLIKAIEKNPYNLTYYVDENVYKNVIVYEGDDITPEPAPIKEGYTFSGWSDIPAIMPAHDVSVIGSFIINNYKLTYMIDYEIYKETVYEYGAAITPEPQPEGNYQTFEWVDLPQIMPANDVVVHASYTSGTSGIIKNLNSSLHNIELYSPSGKKLDKLQKGINIVVYDDGIVHKIKVK